MKCVSHYSCLDKTKQGLGLCSGCCRPQPPSKGAALPAVQRVSGVVLPWCCQPSLPRKVWRVPWQTCGAPCQSTGGAKFAWGPWRLNKPLQQKSVVVFILN